MDSLIPIIIFIIAFIVKVFADSNKKEQEKRKPVPQQQRDRNTSGYSRNQSTGQTYTSPSQTKQKDAYSGKQILRKEIPVSKSSSTAGPGVSNVDIKPDAAQKEVEKGNYHIIATVSKVENPKLNSIKDKIYRPKSIKELMLVSEILNKPKALQRW